MIQLQRQLAVLLLLLLAAALALTVPGCDDNEKNIVNPPADTTSPFPYSASDFDAATTCQPCHPNHYDEWSGSMHAYSITDPVFAKVREVGQSAYVNALDGACTQCHSAIAKRSGDIRWGPFDLDAIAPQSREGVGCDLCHTVTGIENLSNGGLIFGPNHTKFGTIQNPEGNDVHGSTYNSLYAASEYCGACHDFVTNTGFPLETTFREWRAGGFAMTGKTCNDCHMPAKTGPAAVGGPTRTLHDHRFIGADLALVAFPNQTEQRLLVEQMLQDALTMSVNAPANVTAGNALSFSVDITNDKTAHNVPSGVPFNRQMWLSIVATNAAGDTLYSSGQLDANLDLMDDNSAFPERDLDLFNAQATMLNAAGDPTGATWEAVDLIDPSIKPNETRNVPYSFTVPGGTTGDITLSVTLRFRSFAPYLFRNLGLESLLPIPIVDMNTGAATVTVL